MHYAKTNCPGPGAVDDADVARGGGQVPAGLTPRPAGGPQWVPRRGPPLPPGRKGGCSPVPPGGIAGTAALKPAALIQRREPSADEGGGPEQRPRPKGTREPRR